MSRIPEATNIGHLQRYLEAAHEHINHVWGALRRAGLDTVPQTGTPADTDGRKPGTADYHLAAAEEYLIRGLWGSYQFVGRTDGQLCPNENCAHHLAFYGEGWYRCPVCETAFLSTETDSDFEDYHVDPETGDSVLPDNVPYARDLGPSWATPKRTK